MFGGRQIERVDRYRQATVSTCRVIGQTCRDVRYLSMDGIRQRLLLLPPPPGTKRYPTCKFVLGDVLIPGGMSSVRELCELHLVGTAPTVVCIDINGNREIEGVLGCIGAVMNEPWSRLPRMIIVKSRFLYWEIKKDRG